MAAAFDIAALRQAVADNRYIITQHAKQRMGARCVADEDIKRVVAFGDVVEQNLDSVPHPKVLLMAKVQGEPLYASCAFDGRLVHIITVHWYDPSIWSDPWTRRKP